MNLIEKSQKELEIDRNEFLLMRQKVATEKTAIQSMLVAVNLKLRVRLSRSDFLSLQNQRADLIRQQEEKEREIQELKAKQTEIQTVIDFKKSEGLQPSDVRNLTDLRDKWHNYSMDSSNHQKSREIAWKISQELREILNPIFGK